MDHYRILWHRIIPISHFSCIFRAFFEDEFGVQITIFFLNLRLVLLLCYEDALNTSITTWCIFLQPRWQHRRHRRAARCARQLRYRQRRQASTCTADPRHSIIPSTCGPRIIRHNPLILNLPLRKIATELLTLLQPPLDVCCAHAAQAAVGRADLGFLALFASHFDDKGAALDGVHEDEAGLEVGVRGPRAQESNSAATLILVVFGVDVEEAGLADTAASGVRGDGVDVQDVESVAIVGLVEVVVYNVLVVVDASALALVVARVEGILQVADVEDVSGRQTLGHRSHLCIALVEFVVEEEVLLPRDVVDRALMDVLGARVRRPRDDRRRVARLIRNIIDGKCILIARVANITAVVSGVWAAVYQAFCVMYIPVTACTSGTGRVGRVSHVNENETSAAWKVSTDTDSLVAADGANGNGVVEFGVDDNVVCPAYGQVIPLVAQPPMAG